MTTPLAIFLLSFLLALVITPLVRRIGYLCGAVDLPSICKVHSIPIPRIGGLAIILSYFASLLIISFAKTNVSNLLLFIDKRTLFLVLGGVVVVGIGLIDDFRHLGYRTKFLGQILGASIAYFGGVKITTFSAFGISVVFEVSSYFITVFWFLLFINAMNLVDGLDGLAAGVSFFTSMIMIAYLAALGHYFIAMHFAALAGSLLGFLRYNFNPASIFMGDGGSYFLGYILAGLSILESCKCTMTTVILIPLLALGVPVFDTILSPVRRFLRGRGMFHPDKGHIHHKLLKMGLTTRRAVLVIYALTLGLGVFSLTIVHLRSEFLGFFLFILSVGLFIFVRKLGYMEYFTSDKVLGWLRDMIDAAGITRERRSFLNLQIEIHESPTPKTLWQNVAQALEMLKFDCAYFYTNNNGGQRAQGPTLEQRPASFEKASATVSEEELVWSWKRYHHNTSENNNINGRSMMRIELPLLDGQICPAHYGVLLLLKDLNHGMSSHYSLRRVEHLQMTLVSALRKFHSTEERSSEIDNLYEEL